jgi:hypothetical protein
MDTKRRCVKCGELHKCKKDNYCKNCRGDIIQIGKYQGKTYRHIFDNYKSYCSWVINLKNPFFELSRFQEWLHEQKPVAGKWITISEFMASKQIFTHGLVPKPKIKSTQNRMKTLLLIILIILINSNTYTYEKEDEERTKLVKKKTKTVFMGH